MIVEKRMLKAKAESSCNVRMRSKAREGDEGGELLPHIMTVGIAVFVIGVVLCGWSIIICGSVSLPLVEPRAHAVHGALCIAVLSLHQQP